MYPDDIPFVILRLAVRNAVLGRLRQAPFDSVSPAVRAAEQLARGKYLVTVAGCKQLDWHSERRLIDVGLSTSRWAAASGATGFDPASPGGASPSIQSPRPRP